MSFTKNIPRFFKFSPVYSNGAPYRSGHLGDLGGGAGKGGGGGGTIRSAGGAFGKMQAQREEEYFYKKTIVLDPEIIIKQPRKLENFQAKYLKELNNYFKVDTVKS
ncbi:uncharacterized protein isoform X3 [Rhodnius prolixus]|uniref:uncharacterized protein isoform X3 n=1 Tax=Rhodnius prolixus TaxID=13249 RepID=UPI003D189CEA